MWPFALGPKCELVNQFFCDLVEFSLAKIYSNNRLYYCLSTMGGFNTLLSNNWLILKISFQKWCSQKYPKKIIFLQKIVFFLEKNKNLKKIQHLKNEMCWSCQGTMVINRQLTQVDLTLVNPQNRSLTLSLQFKKLLKQH